ncbi:MAG TPA: hypothetical protein VFI69_05785, partial [Candidatus Limnocylindrales bacterium]|nr:hypothetical protein [Candidatus Limnocylindrales bacterium]
TRFLLENLRADNWTFFGVPTAQLVSIVIIAIGIGGLIVRHTRPHAADRPPTHPQVATWGALGATWMTKPIDEPWANVPPPLGQEADGPGATRDVAVEPPADAAADPAADMGSGSEPPPRPPG